jgi:hypothetical protein
MLFTCPIQFLTKHLNFIKNNKDVKIESVCPRKEEAAHAQLLFFASRFSMNIFNFSQLISYFDTNAPAFFSQVISVRTSAYVWPGHGMCA